MKDDDWNTPRISKDKSLLVKVSNGCFPIELCAFAVFFFWSMVKALAPRAFSLFLNFVEISMFWDILFPSHR